MIDSVPPTALAALQRRFAMIDLSGETRVVDRTQITDLLTGTRRQDLSFYRRAEAEIWMRRALEVLPAQSNPRQVISDFWSSPSTVVYNAIAFTPAATPASTLNFWVGPVAQAKAGNWVILRDFLRDIICAGDASVFDYLIRFMAHMIQKPEEKPGVMIVLLGGQGTGKGMYFRLLEAIWSRTTLLVSDIEQVTGRFNACLERNFNVCMDEAIFAGDRKAMDRLKSTATEPIIQVEQKYQPARSIQSVHRLFAASNHSHFANIELDDRRFVVLQVSNSKQQNTTYFSAIFAAINDPATLRALVYYLQRKDLTTFNVRSKPNTAGHLDQRLKSLQGFDRFWYEVLTTGYLNGKGKVGLWPDEDDEWSGPRFVPSELLTIRYRDFNRVAQKHQTVQTSEVTTRVRELCPSVQTSRQVVRSPAVAAGMQRRGLELPDLATARSDFERVVGGKVPWD